MSTYIFLYKMCDRRHTFYIREVNMLCEFCKNTSGICTVCILTRGPCIYVRYCPTERALVMNDLYKKNGCKIKKNKKEGE